MKNTVRQRLTNDSFSHVSQCLQYSSLCLYMNLNEFPDFAYMYFHDSTLARCSSYPLAKDCCQNTSKVPSPCSSSIVLLLVLFEYTFICACMTP